MSDYEIEYGSDVDVDSDIDVDIENEANSDVEDNMFGEGIEETGYQATPLVDIDILTEEGIVPLAELQESIESGEKDDNKFFTIEFEESESQDDGGEVASFDVSFIENDEVEEFDELHEDVEQFENQYSLDEVIEELIPHLSKDELEHFSEALQQEEYQEQLREIAGKDKSDALFDLYCIASECTTEYDIHKTKDN